MLLLPVIASAALATENGGMRNDADAQIRWASMPVSFVIDGANDEDLDEGSVVYSVVSAASAWNRVDGAGVDLDFGGSATGDEDAEMGDVVSFTSDWTDSPELLAVTRVWSMTDGTAIGFQMLVNEADHDWSLDGAMETVDLQNALTHEFGHALGLGHLDDADATMYGTALTGEVSKRDLSEADEDAILGLYEGGGDLSSEPTKVEDDAFPWASFGCSSAPGVPVVPGVGIALALVLRRSREFPCSR